MNMDTKIPTTSTPIVLDHPIQNLQTTVLQLTEQVKQLQRELGVQIGKFNERVRPMETFLTNEEKKKQKFEEARRWLNLGGCGMGRIMMEQRKRENEKENQGIDVLRPPRGLIMCGGGTGRRTVEMNNPGVIVYLDPERFRVKNDKGVGESSRSQGGRGEGRKGER
ncbi:hypothetical protein NA56DRAFT_703563 [Hyaloscypha hepaticicola]|uniref:Uncharacterized protein n=1 Tax=Hyaloscypha hepaticicola TaxID=2082293 RepID=A0A2J6Q5C7_9HELO|nr:hypothetical protein NA56DRAFT_703563 [Hyaloscypha hepaticicola]